MGLCEGMKIYLVLPLFYTAKCLEIPNWTPCTTYHSYNNSSGLIRKTLTYLEFRGRFMLPEMKVKVIQALS